MAERRLHPTAIIEQGAKLGAGVKIGPFCVVGREVALGEGVELVSHVAAAGTTAIRSAYADISVCLHRAPAPGSQISRRAVHSERGRRLHHP